MLEVNRKFFNSPKFTDPDLSRLVHIANILSIIPIFYGIATGIMLWLFDLLPKTYIYIFILCTIAILITSLVLIRKGIILFARVMLVTFQWICMTIIIVTYFKGNISHAIDSYLLVILFAGLLLGEKTALVFAIINLVSLITISLFFPHVSTDQFGPNIGTLFHLVNFLLLTSLVIIADRYIKRGYQAAKDKEAELIKSNNELLELRSQLEKHVEDRSKDLIKQKKYYEALIYNFPLAIATLDLDQEIIACNRAFETLFGYSENEVIGTYLDDLVSAPEFLAEAESYTQRTLRGESIFAIGKRRKKSGQLIDVEIHSMPVMVENQIIGFYGLYNDISQRVLTENALRESEERHRIFFENVSIPLWEEDFSDVKVFIDNLKQDGVTNFQAYFEEHPEIIIQCAKCAKIINVNRATLALYCAKNKDELIGSLDTVLGEESYKTFQDEVLTLMEGKTTFSTEILNKTLTGRIITIWLELSLAPGSENSWNKVFVSTTDITMQKQTQDKLYESENRQRLILESMPVLMFAMDENNLIKTWNQQCEITTGYRSEEIIDNPKAIEFLFPKPEYRKFALYELANRGNDFSNLELEFTTKNSGQKIISWSNISNRLPISGWSFWATGVDITERKITEEKLKYLASHDTLTELPNRSLFNDRLNHAIPLAKRNNQHIAVIFLDLDNFKIVNDTLGHEKGDELLIEVANRVVKCLRESDTVARVGGDEFAFVLENIATNDDVIHIVEKIIHAISAPMTIGGHIWNITPSIGITLFPEDGTDAETLIKKADIAMYAVKERGKNGYQFFSKIRVSNKKAE